MIGYFFVLYVASSSATPADLRREHEKLAREKIAQIALTQFQGYSPDWNASQRDCAGLIRFVYRSAFARTLPKSVPQALWVDDSGRPSDFADAQTLLSHSFVNLGRESSLRDQLKSGDLVAFRQGLVTSEQIYHLMLILVASDRAQVPLKVIYHTGEKDSRLRTGSLRSLEQDAPTEWQPTESNLSFLGYFRFKEWIR